VAAAYDTADILMNVDILFIIQDLSISEELKRITKRDGMLTMDVVNMRRLKYHQH
jgi:hypothetical protein